MQEIFCSRTVIMTVNGTSKRLFCIDDRKRIGDDAYFKMSSSAIFPISLRWNWMLEINNKLRTLKHFNIWMLRMLALFCFYKQRKRSEQPQRRVSNAYI